MKIPAIDSRQGGVREFTVKKALTNKKALWQHHWKWWYVVIKENNFKKN